MTHSKLKITLCHTCVRDNYGEGVFSETDALESAYREGLKSLESAQMPDIERHNCFNYCELYYCMRVEQQDTGVLLKEISDPEKIRAVCDWVKDCAQGQPFEVPESLKGHVIEKQKLSN